MAPSSPDPTAPTEVSARPRRRTFTADYKRRIVREADSCHKPGEIGALLRREGLYSSHLTEWRRARELGQLAGETRPRGPKPQLPDPRDLRIAALERENALLQERIRRAGLLVELQKKLSLLLEMAPLDPSGKP